ncbi:MAG: pyruvate formate lyase-activating protein [Ruminococcaceae bacterium]|nr:pyruvate formate lyase-activating protein [Oscillospiraceae bacterium]
MTGRIHSIQSMGTVDGPGVRAVVFMSGCPLRCIYCHNPDTWDFHSGEEYTVNDLAAKILRYKPYIKDGGVTFSGGEPCMQADYLYEVATILKENGLHIAIDTSGVVLNDSVKKLLGVVDLVLLDIKMTTEDEYIRYTRQSLKSAISFLDELENMHKDTWIRHVVVPGINDSIDDIKKLGQLLSGYGCIKKIELLPFKKLCLEKYKKLDIPFQLENTPQMSEERLNKLYKAL